MACQSLSSDGRPNKRYSPILSNIKQYFLPSNTRIPRPTCCRYFANDSVGLANWINSTSGQSKPSPNKSTFTNTCMLAFCFKETLQGLLQESPTLVSLNLSMIACLSSSDVLLLIATAFMPCCLYASAICSAWAMSMA